MRSPVCGARRAIPCLAAVTALLASVSVSAPANAEDVYVRDGASGSGTSWSDALDDLPATLVRGNTYWIADGTYAPYTFDDAAAGTTMIVLRKATAANHGAESGWNASFGDAQARFGPLRHDVPAGGGHLEIDGQVDYGFVVDFDEGETGFDFVRGGSQIALRHVDFDGIASHAEHSYAAATRAIRIEPSSGATTDATDGIVISHCALHGAETLLQDTEANTGILVEHSDFYDNLSTSPDWHSNVYFAASVGGTFRFNRVHHHNEEGLVMTYQPRDWLVYGNVFYDGVGPAARGIELAPGFTYSRIRIANNSFASLARFGIANRATRCTACEIRNNLGFRAELATGDAVAGYNVTVTTDPFVGASRGDFHLTAATVGGAALASPVDVDPDGNTRGGDGVWDLGAFEYCVGSACHAATMVDAGVPLDAGPVDVDAGVETLGPCDVRVDVAVGTPTSVAVPCTGRYELVANVHAENDGTNSFYVDIDADPSEDETRVFDFDPSPFFLDQVVSTRGSCDFTCAEFDPKIWMLEAGAHTLYFMVREPGAGLRSVKLVRVDAFDAGSGRGDAGPRTDAGVGPRRDAGPASDAGPARDAGPAHDGGASSGEDPSGCSCRAPLAAGRTRGAVAWAAAASVLAWNRRRRKRAR